MIFEVTFQVRVSDIKEGHKWYEVVLNKKPDLQPHSGFIEWEILPGCWLQVAEGIPSKASGPLRLGVTNIIAERERLVKELGIDRFEIHSREEVSAKWGTFTDPWGNQLGFFEYLDKKEEKERIKQIVEGSF
ncbi:ornithine monooxygenase [Bacillus sp. FJAT-22090]|uniref:VOC family protein n=1 Tax=Bacillus sp. FJAT-22090 TaxID=1581038 RepID=UPI0006AEDF0B|nr:ornithine monooxygenase [Bacillus sp. FJAT-22090]ALC85110.1 ornithine monooxygenase [Bacillus sp. FJAT-22090]